MPSPNDLKAICRNHLANGHILRKHAKGKACHYHGACYTAGYSVEAILKAAICVVTGASDYDALTPGSAYRRHRPMELISRLTMDDRFNQFAMTANFAVYNYSDPVFEWDSVQRYKPSWRQTATETRDFLKAIENFMDIVESEF